MKMRETSDILINNIYFQFAFKANNERVTTSIIALALGKR